MPVPQGVEELVEVIRDLSKTYPGTDRRCDCAGEGRQVVEGP